MATTKVVQEDINRWAAQDRNSWETRNARFSRDQDTFSLHAPDRSSWTPQDSDVMIMNDPRVLVKKMARLLARHPGIIEVPARSAELTDVAQRMETFLRNWRAAVEARWIEGLNNPLNFDEAFFLCLRGWLTVRTMLRDEAEPDMDDAAGLYDHRLFDPATVYPRVAGGQITRVTHWYRTTMGDVKGDPFLREQIEKNKDYDDVEERTPADVKALYWRDVDGGWWHAVLLGSDSFLKEPTEIGYLPWTIVLANGASYRATPWDESQFIDQVGTGVLDDTVENTRYLNKTVTKLSTLLSLEANPPVTLYSDGRVRRIGLRPGERNFLLQKDRLEAHRIGPNAGDYELLWNILMQRQERGTMPAPFFAEGEGLANTSALLSAGRDLLFPYAAALNAMDRAVYTKVLTLYRDFGPGKPLPVRLPAGAQLGVMGGQVAPVTELSAQEIAAQGVHLEITRVDMTPTELSQKVNLSLAMVKEGLISRETARGQDWIGLANPGREQARIQNEMLESVLFEQQLQRATGGAGVGGPPATGPVPPGPAAPLGLPPAEGMPAEVLPPTLQSGNLLTNLPVPPEQAAINAVLAQITGGAMGGAGAGGIPPVPGTTAPVPPMFPPPNRLF
jgi:hypothetical protein